MFARFVFLIALLLCLGQIFAGFVRMEPSVNTFSSPNWIKERNLGEKDVIKAIFALKRSPAQVARLEQELLARSTPSNKLYGKWLSVSFFIYILQIRFLFCTKIKFLIYKLIFRLKKSSPTLLHLLRT
jgi:hypothetical protein